MSFSLFLRAFVPPVLLLGSTLSICASPPIDFNRDVLPILSDACFRCHGPDEKARKKQLRLDQRDGIFRTREEITVVVPGDVKNSELVARISNEDPEERMPPLKANRKLTQHEIEILTRWVGEGAQWNGQWAIQPMQKPAVPEVKNRAWPRNEIDRFVLARIDSENLAASPEADRERLLRRVSLDLTGLPPTPAEMDAFAADTKSDAFEKVVDRLLASPRFGERLASDWLDLARYADTHGYQMDRPNRMWPWRDWVITAFNANMPYARFVSSQLAGDLLPGATKDDRLATGFNRLHSQTEEGGVVEEEYRVAYNVDRVDTFGTAFLGLTIGCARCHDHKFDPITQRDYYSLFSFFQNIDEAGQIPYVNFADAVPVPTVLLSTREQDYRLGDLEKAAIAASAELARTRDAARSEFGAWLEKKGAMPDKLPGLVAQFSFDSIQKGEVANSIDPAKPGKLIESPTLAPGPHGNAAYLDGENGFTFPGTGQFKRTDAFSLSLWLKMPEPALRAVIAHRSKAPIDAGSRGYELLLENGRVAFGLHYLWPGASLKVVTKTVIAPNEWTHIIAAYDGSSRAAGVRIFVNGEPAGLEVIRDGLYKDITYAKDEPDLAIGQRFRDNGFKGGAVDEFCVFDRALTPLEAAQLAGRTDFADAWNAPPGHLDAKTRSVLFDFYAATVNDQTIAAERQLHVLREEQNALITPIPEAMAMQELPEPKPAHILKRGAYDALGDEVHAATPGALPPFPGDAPHNRLGLARWLLDAEHPLTARVAVNRFWQMMFGRGIVETSDNFGMQGTPPSHPELLDWLARDFIASGWDIKALLKKIALSATYRQSSKTSPELFARDPQNVLITRGPARRLSAEMLRDQALAVSGLLVEKIGGPPVKPYQPPGLWEEIAMGKPHYDQGHGDNLHRRSIYSFWKRTVPAPAMITFDAAERNVCTVRRQNTSTPLQSLAMLNDVQIVEAARLIAQRMLEEGGATTADRVAWAFRLVASRFATPDELTILRQLYEEQHRIFSADSAAANKLLAFGEAKSRSQLDPADLAAGTMLATALLNSDDALMRR